MFFFILGIYNQNNQLYIYIFFLKKTNLLGLNLCLLLAVSFKCSFLCHCHFLVMVFILLFWWLLFFCLLSFGKQYCTSSPGKASGIWGDHHSVASRGAREAQGPPKGNALLIVMYWIYLDKKCQLLLLPNRHRFCDENTIYKLHKNGLTLILIDKKIYY